MLGQEEETLPTVPYIRTIRTASRAVPVAILILASVSLTACSSSPGGDVPTSGNAPTVEDASTGQELFASNCAVCHGAGGEGQPEWRVRKEDGTLPPPPLNGDGHTWHHADGLLYRIVSQGGKIFEDPRYPSFKRAPCRRLGDRLSDQEIIAVLTYIKSLWRDEAERGLSIQESQALVSKGGPIPVGWRVVTNCRTTVSRTTNVRWVSPIGALI